MPQLTFHGAVRTVTGSKTLLASEGAAGNAERVLVDCGLFQGLKELRQRNWKRPAFDIDALDALILTHAHIDHSGYLPRLIKHGFRAPVYATPPTIDLAHVLLPDSAKIQEEDARWYNKKKLSKHKPALPLYDSDDVERALALLQAVPYDTWFDVTPSIRARFLDVGHILGSAMVEVHVTQGNETQRILWSGDVGRYDMPLNPDPQPPPEVDTLIVESTYGDRDHPDGPPLDGFEELLQRMMRQRSVLLIPAFAIGRAQQIIFMARECILEGRVAEFPIYLDSPMAVNATEIYLRYHDLHDVDDASLQDDDRCLLYGPNVHQVRSVRDSKALNGLEGPAMIISSSGMLTGGRVLHHLKHLLPDRHSLIALAGYQAAGTRGRALEEGARSLRIHGHDVPVRAQIVDLGGMSGHADRRELLRWVSGLQQDPQRVFVTHGEEHASMALAESLQRQRGWNAIVPRLGTVYSLTEAGTHG
jgi:metallo-beta-lactamase family protein